MKHLIICGAQGSGKTSFAELVFALSSSTMKPEQLHDEETKYYILQMINSGNLFKPHIFTCQKDIDYEEIIDSQRDNVLIVKLSTL